MKTTTSSSKTILGVSCFYHDASAAIVKNGKLVAAAEEERFTRQKHDVSFPINSIKYCLAEAGVRASELAGVAFYEKPLLKFERVLDQHVEMYPQSFEPFAEMMPSWFNERLRIASLLKKHTGYTGDIYYVPHHLCHAASSYLVSPYKDAALLTVDGVGEWVTTAMGYAKGNDVRLTKVIDFPHSIGLLYSALTAYLGFTVNNSEYKVMGLSAYGNPKPYYDKVKKLIDIRDDGSYALDMSYFVYHYKMSMPGEKFIRLFGPARKKTDPVEQRHKDIAAAFQKVTEEAVFALVNSAYREHPSKNLCMAGGVALNSVANGKILGKSKFKNIFIQPASGDGGTSLGAAFYVWNSLLGNKRQFVLNHSFWGPGYSDAYISNFLKSSGVKCRKFSSRSDKIKTTAKLIADSNVIGWFQGRMEWGPRALGSRSILSDPTNREMQDILNLKVKHREKFRPFAPVVCEDDAAKYFEVDKPIPAPTDFMLMVYPIKKQYHKQIPAVTHVDGSGRLQTIRRSQNPDYYDLIKEFGRLKRIPILINTSFNIRGEPIVCTPQDAYRCMMGTGIDYLVMGDFLIKRADNPKHMWNSEASAND